VGADAGPRWAPRRVDASSSTEVGPPDVSMLELNPALDREFGAEG
jgi:hypothetical protein